MCGRVALATISIHFYLISLHKDVAEMPRKLSSIRLDSYSAKNFYTSVANSAIFPSRLALFSYFLAWFYAIWLLFAANILATLFLFKQPTQISWQFY